VYVRKTCNGIESVVSVNANAFLPGDSLARRNLDDRAERQIVHGNNHKPDRPDRVLVSCKAARAIRSSVSITCRYPATANKLGLRNRADASLYGRAATGVTVKLRRVLSRAARSYRPPKYAKCPLLTRKLQISLAPAERESDNNDKRRRKACRDKRE